MKTNKLMKKILFYTANGVGLGHLRRTSLIAQSIINLNPKIDIFFTTMCQKIFFLSEMKIPYIKLNHLTDELLKNKRQFDKTKTFNEKVFLEIVGRYRPEMIIIDVHLFGFSFPKIVLSPAFKDITKVLIFRKGDKESFCRILRENKEIIDKFKKIILPHSLIELKETLPRKIFNKITKDRRFVITGSIFRELNQKRIKRCRSKYNISDEDFLITVTLGGGGEFIKGKCETPANIIFSFVKNYKKIKKIIPNVRVIINIGPLFYHNKKLEAIKKQYNIKVLSYEKNLLELMHLSKLVISPASYNTCNEIIEAKTPAILIPLLRDNNEQLERALYLEKKGIINILYNNSDDQFIDLITDCRKNLDKMKNNFRKFSDWKQGNNKAAKEILKTLDE